MLENAQLLVSEVVTNAIVHARSDSGLTVSLVREFVRVEVADHSPHLPVLKQCDDDSVTGYGLDLVARLAADFGAIIHEAGKAVWFTLGQHAGRYPNPAHPPTWQQASRHIRSTLQPNRSRIGTMPAAQWWT